MKTNVGVFFGGSSVEHEVSIISALQAILALDKVRFMPLPVYITKDGEMYTGEALLSIENYKDTQKLCKQSLKVTLTRENGSVWLIRTAGGMFKKRRFKIDLALPVVHGTHCEDGSLAGLFEVLRLPYAGSDVLSSAVGMDKIVMKHVLAAHGLPLVDFVSFHSKQWYGQTPTYISMIEEKLGYPVVVKPANLGSSVGISKAHGREDLEKSIELATGFADKVIVEKAVVHLKEINCAVLGDHENVSASALEEPVGQDVILSYQDKYMNETSGKGMHHAKRKLPAELSKDLESRIQELAKKTFQALGCNGCARVDFLIDEEEKDAVYVNEINTIPGSLSFYLWEANGKSFSALLNEMLELALKRERERNQLMFTYDENILAMGSWNGQKGTKGGFRT
jgi:D-alanine-D-alanine ligase